MSDVASQGELFINVSGAGAALLKLLKIKSLDIKDGRSTEVVLAIGVERGAGFRRKQGGFEIDATSYRQVGRTPEVDWFIVNNSYATFTLTVVNEQGGFRESFACRISKIDSKMDAEGNWEDTISMACLGVTRS